MTKSTMACGCPPPTARRKKKALSADALTNNILGFVDGHGTITDKGFHTFSSWLEMEYKDDGLAARFRAQQSPYSNGGVEVTVKKDGKTIFDAQGSFVTSAFDMKVKTWVHGAWEKKFPAWKGRR